MSEPTIEDIRKTVKARNWDGSTHWDDCALDPRHRDCAILAILAEVERLQAEVVRLHEGRRTCDAFSGECCGLTWQGPATDCPLCSAKAAWLAVSQLHVKLAGLQQALTGLQRFDWGEFWTERLWVKASDLDAILKQDQP